MCRECSNDVGHGKVAAVDGSRARRGVWVVAAAAFAVQLALGSFVRAPSWDEAIYLSQVTKGAHALPFVASRARGITFLVVPLSSVGAPLWLIRVFLAVASAVVLALVFRSWVPLVGWGAAAGAGLFALSWPALFYGSEVMPNLWSALLAVGAAGLVARQIAGGTDRRPQLMSSAAMFGLMALVRPTDAVILALALSVAVGVMRGSPRVVVAMLVGAAVGVIPWLVEMSARFDGPVNAVRSARELSHLAGGVGGVSGHLALTDGPLLGPDSGGIPLAGALWWLGLVGLVAVALARRADRPLTIAIRLATVGGIALAAEYVFLVAGLAPRFLLPALALVSLVAGCGLDALRGVRRIGRPALAMMAIVPAIWLVWQGTTYNRLERQAASERSVPEEVGAAIGARVIDPCSVASSDDYPQVAFAARCAGTQFRGSLAPLIAEANAGYEVVVVTRSEGLDGGSTDAIPLPVRDWVATRVPAETHG
jgi:hypothetical protein